MVTSASCYLEIARALLIKKLEHAIATSRDRTAHRVRTAPTSPREPELIVDSSPPAAKPPVRLRRGTKRGRALKGHQAAIDQALDAFGNRDETDDGEDE